MICIFNITIFLQFTYIGCQLSVSANSPALQGRKGRNGPKEGLIILLPNKP